MQIVVAYRGIPHARGWETGSSLARALRSLGHEVYCYGNYYQTREPIDPREPPRRADLLIYCECNDHDPQYTELRDFPAAVRIYWNFDVNHYPRQTLRFIRAMGFDHVCYASAYYRPLLRLVAPSVYFLPYAVDPELHRPPPDVTRTRDVVLVGTPFPERQRVVRRLQEAGIDAQILSGIYREEMIRAVASARIHLNYNVDIGAGLLVGRVWETLGTGTLLLTQDRDGISHYFRHREHLVLYGSVENAIEQIRRLLAAPAALEAVAAAGHRYALEHHTYRQRALRLLEIAEGRAGADAPPPFRVREALILAQASLRLAARQTLGPLRTRLRGAGA